MSQKISEELKELVIARLETIPADKKISIGNFGEFNKDELIQHIIKGDALGIKMVEIELEFLRAIKEGLLWP